MLAKEAFIQKHKIFVEGIADQVFIRDIFLAFYGIVLTESELKQSIINVKGKDNLKNLVNEFKEISNKRLGGRNLVIFDADYYDIGGGRQKISEWLSNLKTEINVDFEYFLFTDENGVEGTIESLLESCIHPNHAGIFECWNSFEACVRATSERYTLPAKKSKIYLYLECLYGKSASEKEKVKDANRKFLEDDKWVLDFEHNNLLAQLKSFLDNNLI